MARIYPTISDTRKGRMGKHNPTNIVGGRIIRTGMSLTEKISDSVFGLLYSSGRAAARTGYNVKNFLYNYFTGDPDGKPETEYFPTRRK